MVGLKFDARYGNRFSEAISAQVTARAAVRLATTVRRALVRIVQRLRHSRASQCRRSPVKVGDVRDRNTENLDEFDACSTWQACQ